MIADVFIAWAYMIMFAAFMGTKNRVLAAYTMSWSLLVIGGNGFLHYLNDNFFTVYAQYQNIACALASALASLLVLHLCKSTKTAFFIFCYGLVHVYSLAAIYYPLYNLTDRSYAALIILIDALVILSVVDYGTGFYSRIGRAASRLFKHRPPNVEA